MLPRADFLQIVINEGFSNPRTGAYVVAPLTESATAYPYVDGGNAVASVAMQFSVEHKQDLSRRRVVTVARGPEGYAVWCGDPYTEGRNFTDNEARELAFAASSVLSHEHYVDAFKGMIHRFGAYPHHAPCHFWRAWHSHQGLCKHVAAALQFVEHHCGGVEPLLDDLDAAYVEILGLPLDEEALTELANTDMEAGEGASFVQSLELCFLEFDFSLVPRGLPLDIDLSKIEQEAQAQREKKTQAIRGEIQALFAEATAPVGGMRSNQFATLQHLLSMLSAERA